MKKFLALILILALALGTLSGCVAGKTAVLFVEDTRAESSKLIWAGFSAAAKKMGMKPILSGLTEEQANEYTALQIWEQDIAEHDPHVMAVVGLSDSEIFSLFSDQQEIPVVAVDPVNFSATQEHFCIYSATDAELARMAAEHIIGLQLPTSGRVRLLYDKEDTAVLDTFTSLLESAAYSNLETTPLSGVITEEALLNSFTVDTVGTYNASSYDTAAEDLSNLILSGVTAAHLNALNNDTAISILCRNYYAVGEQAAQAAADALRDKEPAAVTVKPILVTKSGPDQNGAAYWLELLS